MFMNVGCAQLPRFTAGNLLLLLVKVKSFLFVSLRCCVHFVCFSSIMSPTVKLSPVSSASIHFIFTVGTIAGLIDCWLCLIDGRWKFITASTGGSVV